MRPDIIEVHDKEQKASDGSMPDMHVLDLLTVLVARKKFLLLFTLAVTTVTAVVVFLLPNKYKATTVILPPGTNTFAGSSSALLGQITGGSNLVSMAGSSLGLKNPGDMYVALFHSRSTEDALIQRFGLADKYHAKTMADARAALEKHSSVTLGAKDGLIQISFTDRDPNFAAQVANAYIEEYHKRTDRLALTEASQRRVFFQQQLLEATENLTKAEEALKSTEHTTGVFQLDSQARSLIESAAILRGQITAKEVQLEAMRSYATEDNPQVKEVTQELGALKAQLAKMSTAGGGGESDFLISGNKIPEAGMEYINKLRDVRYNETIQELITKQFEAAKLDEARQGAAVQVVDVAVPPDKKSSPMRLQSILIAAILGFLVACVWCIVSDGIKHLAADPQERRRLDTLRAAWHKPDQLQ